jgi:hypothetical protein
MSSYRCTFAVLAVLFGTATSSYALDLQLHGFGDLEGSKTAGSELPINPTIGNSDSRLEVDPESRLGLNLSADLGNNLTFASQLVGQGNSNGTYNLAADWIFVNYKPIEGLTVRAGRQINPAFLYSEQYRIGFLYPWTRLPYEVYGLYPLISFNGLSAIYAYFMHDIQFRAQVFGGGGDVGGNLSATSAVSVSVNDGKGIDLSVSNDNFKVRVGYISSHPTGTVSTGVTIAPSPVGPISGSLTSPLDVGTLQVFSTGGSFDYKNLLAIVEANRVLGSGTFYQSGTGAYGTLAYHVLPWLMPYVTYAWQGNLRGSYFTFPDTSISLTQRTNQHSDIAGLNFRVSPSAVLKTEYMRTQENFQDTKQNFGANIFTASVDFVF